MGLFCSSDFDERGAQEARTVKMRARWREAYAQVEAQAQEDACKVQVSPSPPLVPRRTIVLVQDTPSGRLQRIPARSPVVAHVSTGHPSVPDSRHHFFLRSNVVHIGGSREEVFLALNKRQKSNTTY